MKILTVKQPWASAIFARAFPKDIENRSWPTSSRERIGIHAGVTCDRNATIESTGKEPQGVILGTVEITGCHEAHTSQCDWHHCLDNPWAQWSSTTPTYHWELEHPKELITPIRARGALKLWETSPSATHLLTLAEWHDTPLDHNPPSGPITLPTEQLAFCYPCQHAEHPNIPHPWSDGDAIAQAIEAHNPGTTVACSCPCTRNNNHATETTMTALTIPLTVTNYEKLAAIAEARDFLTVDDLVSDMIERLTHLSPSTPIFAERAVELVAEGYTDAEVAATLSVSNNQVAVARRAAGFAANRRQRGASWSPKPIPFSTMRLS
jgi:hypothetical protein